VSERSVDEAATPRAVSMYTTPDAFVLSVPAVVVERVMKAVERFVVEAVRNDEYIVDEEYPNVWRAVHVLAFPRLRPTVLAVPPLYVPEKVRVESVAEKFARLEPRATPLIVELVSPALSRVPLIVGVNVSAPFVGTTFTPRV
jgi:hypothetical protein